MDSFSNPDRNLGSELQQLQERVAELVNAIRDRDAQRNRALEREAKISALLEPAPQGIITVNERGVILETNGMAERLFGYSRREFEGVSLDALIPERFRVNHSRHHLGFFSDALTRRVACGEDLVALRKDGSEFPVAVSLNHLQTKEGPIAVAFISDLTERRQAEKESRQNEATIAALLESAAQGIVGVDSEGIITIVNAMAEMLFGYSREELIGQPIEVLIPEGASTGYFKHRNNYAGAPKPAPGSQPPPYRPP